MYNLIGIRCFDLARKYKYLGCRKIPNELNFIIVARCQPLRDEFKLSKKQTPKSKVSKRRMAKIKDYLYQKKLYEPLGEAKPLGMKVEDRIRCGKVILGEEFSLQDFQGGEHIWLDKGSIKDYLYQKKLHEPLGEAKPLGMKVEDRISASNKMFLIRQLVNTKMKEGASVVDHANEFKSILSRLVLVVIKFDDERAWYKRYAMDHCCYLKKVSSPSIILLLYVDDMLLAGSYMLRINKLKRPSSQELEMKDLGSSRHEHH
ncbi:retrovirus-related pol polyprotein from transposon TNT 1-94 [Tanacetum coccineum]